MSIGLGCESKRIDGEAPVGIELRVRETAGLVRRQEPVTVGVPLSQGAVNLAARWQLLDSSRFPIPVETRVTGMWPDGSVRWLSATFLASMGAFATAEYELVARKAGPNESPAGKTRRKQKWSLN